MGRVITILNRKGGVAKTTVAFNLAAALADRGQRVLMIDLDPQASLTQCVFGSDETRRMDPMETVAGMFAPQGRPRLAQVVRATPFEGVAIVPGSEALEGFNRVDYRAATRDQQRRIAAALAAEDLPYDYILIDGQPQLGAVSWAALVASDYLIVPMTAEAFGVQGIAKVRAFAAEVVNVANPRLRPLGFLITMFQGRLGVHQSYESMLRNGYDPLIFSTPIPLSSDIKTATDKRLPVNKHRPKSKSADAFNSLAVEVLGRVAAQEIKLHSTGVA